MNREVLNRWAKLQYFDPVVILKEERKVWEQIPRTGIDPKVAGLRTRRLRPFLVGHQAALFAYLTGKLICKEVHFAREENSDYDTVLRWNGDDVENYAPVQLKELVPPSLNRNQSFSDLLSALKKYVDSQELVVAIHVNRRVRLELSKLSQVLLPIRELWLYGFSSPTHEELFLCGDVCSKEPQVHIFKYPI